MKSVILSSTENEVLFFTRHFIISNLAYNCNYSVHVIESDASKIEFLKNVFGKKITTADFSPKNRDTFDIDINFRYENFSTINTNVSSFNFFNISNCCLTPSEWSSDLYKCIFEKESSEKLIDIFCKTFKFIFNIEPMKNTWMSLNKPTILRKSNVAENGIAVRDDDLRMLIKRKFFSDDTRLWHIPIKEDLTKRFFEINYCSNIVTDDYFYAMISLMLGKKVILLDNKSTYGIHDSNLEIIRVISDD